MITLAIAILFTLGVSGLCSLLEAMILSTTTAEIEELKRLNSKRGEMLDLFKVDIEETSSAILALNTIANTLGATLSGGIFTKLFPGDNPLFYFSMGLTLGILIFSEILPKNIGIIYRSALQRHLVYPLWIVRISMYPFSQAGKWIVRFFVGKASVHEDEDQEIILLAERNAKDGLLSDGESTMVSNALRLDDVTVRDIMTPRTVMTAYHAEKTLQEIFEETPNIPFARLPVYEENIDDILGIVRRRDLLKAISEQLGDRKVSSYVHDTVYVPEHASATDALQTFLTNHQQIGIVVDEFGSVSGVISMEDIIEYLLGQEIYEKDDIAVDMRELARRKKLAAKHPSPPHQ